MKVKKIIAWLTAAALLAAPSAAFAGITESEVITNESINVALGKTVYYNESLGLGTNEPDISKMTDGSTKAFNGTEFKTGPGSTYGETYFVVDLGDIYPVSEVKVYPYSTAELQQWGKWNALNYGANIYTASSAEALENIQKNNTFDMSLWSRAGTFSSRVKYDSTEANIVVGDVKLNTEAKCRYVAIDTNAYWGEGNGNNITPWVGEVEIFANVTQKISNVALGKKVTTNIDTTRDLTTLTDGTDDTGTVISGYGTDDKRQQAYFVIDLKNEFSVESVKLTALKMTNAYGVDAGTEVLGGDTADVSSMTKLGSFTENAWGSGSSSECSVSSPKKYRYIALRDPDTAQYSRSRSGSHISEIEIYADTSDTVVNYISPANKDTEFTNVGDSTKAVEVNFLDAMNTSMLNGNYIKITDESGNAVDVSDSRFVTVTDKVYSVNAALLKSDTKYTVTVSGDIETVGGYSSDKEYISVFTTGEIERDVSRYINVAKNKPVFGNDKLPQNETYPLSKITDGITAAGNFAMLGGWDSQTGMENERQYAVIDLLNSYDVNKVIVYVRDGSGIISGFRMGGQILGSADSPVIENMNVLATQADDSLNKLGAVGTYEFDKTKCRYVAIANPAGQMSRWGASICEVEVYAETKENMYDWSVMLGGNVEIDGDLNTEGKYTVSAPVFNFSGDTKTYTAMAVTYDDKGFMNRLTKNIVSVESGDSPAAVGVDIDITAADKKLTVVLTDSIESGKMELDALKRDINIDTNKIAEYELLKDKEEINIVYLGGSVTQGAAASSEDKCWASLVTDGLRERLPGKTINYFNEGIGGTASDYGLFRLHEDVISHNPDIVFIEFAVNDEMLSEPVVQKRMEGIVRKLRELPEPPIVTYVYTTGTWGNSSSRHIPIAENYGIGQIDLKAVVDYVMTNGGAWDEYFADGVHPNDKGYKLYADNVLYSISNFPEKYLRVPEAAEPVYSDWYNVTGSFTAAADMGLDESVWTEYVSTGYYGCQNDGDSLTYTFSGNSVGILHFIGEDCGKLLVSIDLGEAKTVDAYVKGSSHQPCMRYSNFELSSGTHTITITAAEDSRSGSSKVYIGGIYTNAE